MKFANPVFDFPDANLTLMDEFIVKFDPNISEDEIRAFNALNDVEIAALGFASLAMTNDFSPPPNKFEGATRLGKEYRIMKEKGRGQAPLEYKAL